MSNLATLSPEQLSEIKESIKADVIKELTGKDPHTHIEKSPFNTVRDKWARCTGPLHKAFGSYRYARMWDCIRLMSTYAVGCDYVREFTESKAQRASEIAEYLCKYIIGEREGMILKNEKAPDGLPSDQSASELLQPQNTPGSEECQP